MNLTALGAGLLFATSVAAPAILIPLGLNKAGILKEEPSRSYSQPGYHEMIKSLPLK